MEKLSTRTAIFLASIAVVALGFQIAQASDDTEFLIQQVTKKEGVADLCAGLTAPSTCPVNCFRADPVCGNNGVTYWCGCNDAMCAGVAVVKLGACEVGNGGANSLPGQALLLIHIVWLVLLVLLGFSLLFGLF